MCKRKSARSEQPVAGVTKSWKNVAVCVQLTVECCRDDTNIRMFGSEVAQTFRRRNETEKTNACCTRALQRRNSRGGAPTSGEHGIKDEEIALGSVTRDFEVVIDGFECVVIPVQPDVANTRGRNESQYTFNHSKSRAKDWNERQLLAADAVTRRAFKWRVHRHGFEGQRARGLVRQQHREFINELLEDLGRSVATPQQRDLVLHQRVANECEVGVHRAGVHVRQATNFACMAEYRATVARY